MSSQHSLKNRRQLAPMTPPHLLTFLSTALLLANFTSPQAAPDTELPYRPPAEGRWSIGLGWDNDWPAEWRHAQPSRIRRTGKWEIHEGEIVLPSGILKLRDAARPVETPSGVRLQEVRRRWEWTGDQPLDRVTLSFRFELELENSRPFLPSINYYGNPAGRGVDATRIPVIAETAGSEGFYEEHRFSMPFAGIEGAAGGITRFAALHTVPSPLQHGARPDLWWSLGLRRTEREGKPAVELTAYSGLVASNGKRGIVKAQQRQFHPYPDAFLNLPPGAIVEKTFFVQIADVSKRGSGFQLGVWASAAIHEPFEVAGLPPFREVIEAKLHDTARRWHEDDRCAGVDAFPGEERPWIDLGWAGQSEAVGYPMIALRDEFKIGGAKEMAQKALDFIATAPFTKDGFAIRYDYRKHTWFPRRNPLSQGQAMNNLLDALRLGRKEHDLDTTKWEAFLRKASDFHAKRIEALDWSPKSTNEGFLIAPLAKAAKLLNEPRYLAAARKAADHYGARHLSMDDPYWGGTLDARCEDKEGAWAALQGFLAMHEATGEAKYLKWAQHAADVVISYVYVWNVPLPPGRLADHAFKTKGWTSVSVQNMHLDVYGVLCAPAIWRLGELTNRRELKDMARLMTVACGQLVDPFGGQGEQMQQTNYQQHGEFKGVDRIRGDYVEQWTVYWISAHFLVAAAQFEEMGVDWRNW